MNKPVFLPPKGFRPSDLVVRAEYGRGPSFALIQPSNINPAAKRGLNYERKVHGHMGELFAPEQGEALYAPGQWISFFTSDPRDSGQRWAQPDGLLLDFGRSQITIIEIKLRHMQSAWWGLRRLYEPLLRKLYGSRWSFAVCEIVAWYDPAVFWPEPYSLVRNPSFLRRNEFGVMILSEKIIRETQQLRRVAMPQFLPSRGSCPGGERV